MTRDEAEAKIQSALTEMMRILTVDVMPHAREHKIEFTFLDMTYHLFPRSRYSQDTMQVWNAKDENWDTVPRPPAPEGLLVSDDEWESSTFGCSSRYWDWYSEQWPEKDEDEDE